MKSREHYTSEQKERFFKAVEYYKEAYKNMKISGNSTDFIVASIRLHAAKGGVPNSYLRYASEKKLWAECDKELEMMQDI